MRTFFIFRNFSLQSLVTFWWQKKCFFCHQKVTKFCSKFLEIIYVLMNKIKKVSFIGGFWKHFLPIYDTSEIWCSIIGTEKKMVEISVTAEISDEKKILWWRRMIGSFRFCFQNFHFRSLPFGIGLYLILINSSNRSIVNKEPILHDSKCFFSKKKCFGKKKIFLQKDFGREKKK